MLYEKIKGSALTIIAGPCAVENEEMLFELAQAVKACGADMLRGGAFKMRTSPDDFQGLGVEGLRLLRQAGKAAGLAVVSEIVDVRDVATFDEYVDMIQVGARNMYNYPLLKELSHSTKPVLLKRGLSATLEEWMKAAEYIRNGNEKIILCERGIRGFDSITRNVLDIGAIAQLRREGYLIFADPSHAAGRSELVDPLACAAVAAGARGVLIEVHRMPEASLSDGRQALKPDELSALIKRLRNIESMI